MSELHFLELLTDQFSVLEAFPIPILPVEFSQEGATDVRETTLGCVLNEVSVPNKALCVNSTLLFGNSITFRI